MHLPSRGVKTRNLVHPACSLAILLAAVLITACSNETGARKAVPLPYGESTVDVRNLEADFLTWWTYFSDSTTLSDDFVALDSSLQKMAKQSFLEELTTGKYIPLKLPSTDSNTYLQLHPLSPQADRSIAETMVSKSNAVLDQFRMEGTAFPAFSWTTLDGQEFNNHNTRGKYLIVKCWFVACQACIEEMPELNALVAENQDRDDIEFISLAYDSPEALRKFLQRREFTYLVAPVERDYLESDLHVYNYPTHIVVDKGGVIKKVVNTVDELKTALDKTL